MTNNEIPVPVVRFIAAQIDSVPHLETLLLFRETQGIWTEEQIVSRLYISRMAARDILNELTKKQFVRLMPSTSDQYSLDPSWSGSTSAHANLLSQVALTYRQHLVQVTGLIHSKSPASLRNFSDAFDMRKKD